MEMEVDKCSLLNENQRIKKSLPTRVIERITLPEAVDDIGRRKEKFEKGLTIILIISVLAITISSLINTINSHPTVSSAVRNQALQTPLFVICSLDKILPTTLYSINVQVSDTDQNGTILNCEYSLATNQSSCGDLIQFASDPRCISVGGNNENWRIKNTMVPWISLLIQYTKPIASMQSELLFVVKLLHQSRRSSLDSASLGELTMDIVRAGFIYSMGYTQEEADGVLRYPTTLLNLGPLTQGQPINSTYGVVYPFLFNLQLRSVITNVIATQSAADAAFSLIASIGGLASTINTVLSVFIGVILTRICFSDRSAFFEHKTRLAATYFLHEHEQQNRLTSNL
jgi:hypothetical protein